MPNRRKTENAPYSRDHCSEPPSCCGTSRGGKPIWPRRVDIKSIIREDQSSEDPVVIASKANRIASLLRLHLPAAVFECTNPECDFDFVDAVEMMEECTVESLAGDLDNGVEAVEMLNGWLETV